jgi:hypothetical protein
MPLCIVYLQTSVPVQQLEDSHELLKLQHGLPLVRLQHVPEGTDARASLLDSLSITNRLFFVVKKIKDLIIVM